MTPPVISPSRALPDASRLALPESLRPLLDAPLVGAGEPQRFAPSETGPAPVLILGVGNLLMGDEGAGVQVVRWLEEMDPVAGVRLLDGGTGGVNLLAEFDGVAAIFLVDATRDGTPAGTIGCLQPRTVGELPRGLGAHDFGLKDLFAAAALVGRLPELHLYTIAVEEVRPMCTALSAPVAAAVPVVASAVLAHAARVAAAYSESSDIKCCNTIAAAPSPTDAQPAGR